MLKEKDLTFQVEKKELELAIESWKEKYHETKDQMYERPFNSLNGPDILTNSLLVCRDSAKASESDALEKLELLRNDYAAQTLKAMKADLQQLQTIDVPGAR